MADQPIVSDLSDSLSDEAIEKASLPNLASLFEEAQNRGLIKPSPEYSKP